MVETLPSLVSLPPGSCAVVAEIRLPPAEARRLMELGLVPGTPVEVVRYALLQDPVEIRVRGSCLSLPRQEAEAIRVRLSDGT
ncbi:ferrous iron transport protein A [Limisphaera ngatamarikiensis]|jgi:ferrous iron transport protein A|uniref:Ferrous iron transport protein A n=1 Tax=Limisphaera ngatamarikiensis TaxID=1324935 RepID=A0A6M1RDE8_9BACT|nr:FeoA family protein [Limisphaera ngatamarikiensis]NGO38138.1 ferrous iron transport protein A [Limisphaera ngatamarikiensis]